MRKTCPFMRIIAMTLVALAISAVQARAAVTVYADDVVSNNAVSAVARQRKELALEDIDESQDEVAQPVRESVSQLRLDLTEALKGLHSSERAAIVLCCQNGLTHEEAAQVLECPLGTVKTNVLRGKVKLKRWLAGYQDYEHA
jgi:RNA polymerase sigma factor (sigma-70 family)